jgi:hypothetical protein
MFQVWKINCLELNALFRSWLSKPDILCFSEHWLQMDQILHLNIKHYKLADSFCRKKNKHRGSCIFVSNSVNVREVISLKNLGKDKELEISATGLVVVVIVICIHRSRSDVNNFLGILDEIISKVINKGCFLVMCRDWLTYYKKILIRKLY